MKFYELENNDKVASIARWKNFLSVRAVKIKKKKKPWCERWKMKSGSIRFSVLDGLKVSYECGLTTIDDGWTKEGRWNMYRRTWNWRPQQQRTVNYISQISPRNDSQTCLNRSMFGYKAWLFIWLNYCHSLGQLVLRPSKKKKSKQF